MVFTATISRAALESVAATMRPADLAEVRADGYAGGLAAIERSIEVSERAWLALLGGEPACVLGVMRLTAGTALTLPHGRSWMLTGEAVNRHPVDFFRHTRALLRVLSQRYASLSNWIHAGHAQALRWAAAVGFTVGPSVPHGPHGEPFCFAVMGGR